MLRERLGQRSGTLSGGEQQMLAMARALCLEPRGAAARRADRRPDAVDDRQDPRDGGGAARRAASRPSWSSSASMRCCRSPTGCLHRERPQPRHGGGGGTARRPHAGGPPMWALDSDDDPARHGPRRGGSGSGAAAGAACDGGTGPRRRPRLRSPLPTGYYLVGGTLAVAATFLLLALMPKGISGPSLAGACRC